MDPIAEVSLPSAATVEELQRALVEIVDRLNQVIRALNELTAA